VAFSWLEVGIQVVMHSALLPQAPSNMKSVLQAGWLLTVAVGNIIVLIVAGAGHFPKQVRIYLFPSVGLFVCLFVCLRQDLFFFLDLFISCI
jgi:solute carrier family 15 oligopeptide transporter 1